MCFCYTRRRRKRAGLHACDGACCCRRAVRPLEPPLREQAKQSAVDSTTQIPAPVETLLRERIRSVEELEILLLLHAADSQAVPRAEIASKLRIQPHLVSSALAKLLDAGLVSEPTSAAFRFEPRGPELRAPVDDLAKFYPDHRIEVLVFISQNALSRVRQDALRTFSGAFQITGRKKDG